MENLMHTIFINYLNLDDVELAVAAACVIASIYYSYGGSGRGPDDDWKKKIQSHQQRLRQRMKLKKEREEAEKSRLFKKNVVKAVSLILIITRIFG